MITDEEIQDALNLLSKAHNEVLIHREIVNKYSMEKFGVDPGDVDNDLFIDSCDGGCGECCSMTVEEFNESMVECIKMKD